MIDMNPEQERLLEELQSALEAEGSVQPFVRDALEKASYASDDRFDEVHGLLLDLHRAGMLDAVKHQRSMSWTFRELTSDGRTYFTAKQARERDKRLAKRHDYYVVLAGAAAGFFAGLLGGLLLPVIQSAIG